MGVGHVFDSGISTSTIAAYPSRYDIVWGSFNPSPWRSANPSALVSRYYILEEDSVSISGHNLAYWQTYHPDWILYACTPTGTPTHEIAYTPGVGFADVPLDIHNPSVIAYQQRSSLIPYAHAHGYNALAVDEVVLTNIMEGGNPKLGQSILSGYYGCGIWEGSTFVKRYTSKTDPHWAADVINWVKTLHTTLKTDPTISTYKMSLIINHPASGLNTNEEALLPNTDADLNETGYSDYGYYTEQNRAGYFGATLGWTVWAQQHGTHIITVNKYTLGTTITSSQIDYALATYYMGNMGQESLVIAGTSYSVQPYYSQFATSLGTACAVTYGGPTYDHTNPHVYYRRFSGGIAVINSGSLPTAYEYAHLPTNHVYHDVLGRAVTNPLKLVSNDGFTMTTTSPACT
jgi:hypothetical protein